LLRRACLTPSSKVGRSKTAFRRACLTPSPSGGRLGWGLPCHDAPRLRRAALHLQLHLSARRQPCRRAGGARQGAGLPRARAGGRMFAGRCGARPCGRQKTRPAAAGGQPVPGAVQCSPQPIHPHRAGLQPQRLRQPVRVHHVSAPHITQGHLPPHAGRHPRRGSGRLRGDRRARSRQRPGPDEGWA